MEEKNDEAKARKRGGGSVLYWIYPLGNYFVLCASDRGVKESVGEFEVGWTCSFPKLFVFFFLIN